MGFAFPKVQSRKIANAWKVSNRFKDLILQIRPICIAIIPQDCINKENAK